MSPGLTSRPSLSACLLCSFARIFASVAGINLPAFVERRRKAFFCVERWTCVAGINLPAFVERSRRITSGAEALGCVAGINLPAFVERSTS